MTQKDIAEALGFAQSTVAVALNPRSRQKLNPDIVQRIQSYAETIGYRPQRFAQILQGKRSRAVGVVTAGVWNAVSESAVNRLISTLRADEYHIVFETFRSDPQQVLNYLLDNMVECVVLCDSVLSDDTDFLGALQQRNIPIVGFRADCHKGLISSVRQDVKKAFYDLTRLHLALGSQALCLSLPFRDPSKAPPLPPWTNSERALGFCEAIWEAGGDVLYDAGSANALGLPRTRIGKKRSGNKAIGEIVHPVERKEVKNVFELGYTLVQTMARSRKIPTSLLCSNDEMAIGALAACGDFSINVPNRLRISGCDNSEVGNFALLPVATVLQPNNEMVDQVANIVHELVESRCSKPGLHKFACNIIVKASLATEDELDAIFKNSDDSFPDKSTFSRPLDRKFVWGT